jgi:hypothetical protein
MVAMFAPWRLSAAELGPVRGHPDRLGLAVGIEGLPFHMVIGASYALLAALGRDDARTTRNYALALLGMTLACYCLQTPPWRWTMAFCDAIGANLVSAIAVAGCGLLIISAVQSRTSVRGRLIILGTIAFAASGAFLAFDPRCIGGVFAAVDPRIRPFWFSSVFELQSCRRSYITGIRHCLILMSAMMMPAATIAGREWPVLGPRHGFERRHHRRRCDRLCRLVWKLRSMAGLSVLASAFSSLRHAWRGLMVPTAALAVLLSPVGAVPRYCKAIRR